MDDAAVDETPDRPVRQVRQGRGRRIVAIVVAVAVLVAGGVAIASSLGLGGRVVPLSEMTPCDVTLEEGGHVWAPRASYAAVESGLVQRILGDQTALAVHWSWEPDPAGTRPNVTLTSSYSDLGLDQVRSSTFTTATFGEVIETIPVVVGDFLGRPDRALDVMLSVDGQPVGSCRVPGEVFGG